MSQRLLPDVTETQRETEGAAGASTAEVLWTGGWDSTFRVLRLVLVRRVQVQPHYVVDPARPSRETELATMDRIRREVIAQRPEAEKFFLPPRVTPLEEIAPHPSITAAFECVTQRRFLGRQYEWLARYAAERSLRHLELSMEKDTNCYRAVYEFLRPRQSNGEMIYDFDPEAPPSPERELFGRFRFPIADWTKREMREAAIEGGFDEHLENTWSCYHPGKDGQPCGTCNPCAYAMEEGLAWRFPRSSRMRYHFSVKRRVKSVLRRRPAAYKFLKSILAPSR
jgi:hypothetical protein